MAVKGWFAVSLLAFVLTATPASAQSTYFSLQCNSDDWVLSLPYDVLSCDESSDSVNTDFQLYDLDGGSFEDGDTIALAAVNVAETNLVSVDLYGGSPLDTWFDDQSNPTNDEKFIVENLDCDSCQIGDGSRISLQSVSLGKFWSAAGCGGGAVNATATSRGSCEAFEIKIY